MFKKSSPKSDASHEHTVTIRFLDDSDPLHIKYEKHHTGEWLLDKVCDELNLVEKDYFGLRYVDAEKQRHWLDPLKTVHRQMKYVSPLVVCFRVKFYPDDPMKLQEEVTRYSLFLQLRRDLHHGRLLCSSTEANTLAAYIIQSEVGDYHEEDCPAGYVTKFKMLPRQTITDEDKIMEIHKTLSGLVPSEAEEQFLKRACALDTYGVDPHQVQDTKGLSMYLGITHLGVVTFHSNKRSNLFRWDAITKLAFNSKTFVIHTEEDGKKMLVGYRCPTYSACKHLWKCAVEQQAFFTLDRSSEAKKIVSGGGPFRRSTSFRFSGRSQNEVCSYSASHKRSSVDFTRSPSSTLQRRFSQKRPVKPRIEITRATDSDSQADVSVENLSEREVTDERVESPQEQHTEEIVVEAVNNAVETEPEDAVDGKLADEEVKEVDDIEPSLDVTSNHVGEVAESTSGEQERDLKTLEIPDVIEPPVVVDDLQAAPGPSGDNGVDNKMENKVDISTTKTPERTEEMRGIPLVAIVFAVLLLVVAIVVLLDDRIALPMLDAVRKTSAVTSMRDQYYNPAREYVNNRVESLMSS